VPHNLDHHKLLERSLQSLLFVNLFPVRPHEIVPHEVNHRAHVVQIYVGKEVVKFNEGQGGLKNLFATFRRAICYQNELPLFLGDTTTLFEQIIGGSEVPTRNKSIHSTLVDDIVEAVVLEVHVGTVHDEPLHVGGDFLHLLNDRWADVDIDDVPVSRIVHLLGEFAVAASDHQDGVLMLHSILGLEAVLQFGILGIPVEEAALLHISIIPELRFAVMLSVLLLSVLGWGFALLHFALCFDIFMGY
jgi:hypothetical protein